MRISVIRRIVGVLAVAALSVLPLTLLGPAAVAANAAKPTKAAKPSSGSTFNPNLLLQGSTNTAEPSINRWAAMTGCGWRRIRGSTHWASPTSS